MLNRNGKSRHPYLLSKPKGKVFALFYFVFDSFLSYIIIVCFGIISGLQESYKNIIKYFWLPFIQIQEDSFWYFTIK